MADNTQSFRSSFSMGTEPCMAPKPRKGKSILRGLFGRSKTLTEVTDFPERNGVNKAAQSGVLKQTTNPQFESDVTSGPNWMANRSRSAVFMSPAVEDSNSGSRPLISTRSLDRGKIESALSKAYRARFRSTRKVLLDEGESKGSPVSALESESVRKLIEIQRSGRMAKVAVVDDDTSVGVAGPPEPVSFLCHALKGDAAFKESNFEVAAAEYTSAIQKNPLDSDLWSKRSSAHYKMGCVSQAMRDAWKSIELNPDSPHPYYQLGLIYKSMADNTAAVRFIRTALELESKPPPSLVALTLNAETALRTKVSRRRSMVAERSPGISKQDVYLSAANQYPALAY